MSRIEIETVTDEQRLVLAHSVAEAGFEVPEGVFAPFYEPSLLTASEIVCYLGFVAGEPAWIALGYRAPDTVGIFNVATPPRYRRRGLGRRSPRGWPWTALIVAPPSSGLQASTDGEPVYRRMGFREVVTYTLYPPQERDKPRAEERREDHDPSARPTSSALTRFG